SNRWQVRTATKPGWFATTSVGVPAPAEAIPTFSPKASGPAAVSIPAVRAARAVPGAKVARTLVAPAATTAEAAATSVRSDLWQPWQLPTRSPDRPRRPAPGCAPILDLLYA